MRYFRDQQHIKQEREKGNIHLLFNWGRMTEGVLMVVTAEPFRMIWSGVMNGTMRVG